MSLTEDDKKWLTEQFATKQDLETKLERFATKQDLETRLEQYATKVDLERVETNLLTAFHKWAAPVEARQRIHAATLRAHELEIEVLSNRIRKLEDLTGFGASFS